MEQHLGHQAYYQNLRRFLDDDPGIEACWVPVTYSQPGSLWERLPLLPGRLRGALVGRSQVRLGLRRMPYEVALFNTQVPAALAGRVARRRPYVLCTDITPRQYDSMAAAYGHTPDGSGPFSRMKHHWNTELLRGAARLLPWSFWTRVSLIEQYGVDPRRVEVVPPGVDLTLWRPTALSEQIPLRILFVGGDLIRKGGDLLIKAFHTLPSGLAELTLVTRTPLPPEPGVTVYSQMLPNSPDLVRLYNSCHIFVLPSRAEAFGIAAVEAGAAGLPVISTCVGGLPEIVIDGTTGLHIQLEDSVGLACALRTLIENPELRMRMGEAGRRHIEKHFDGQKNAVRIAAILHEIHNYNL
jgi:glycosyltransferase involved in cell wall biosynthesis